MLKPRQIITKENRMSERDEISSVIGGLLDSLSEDHGKMETEIIELKQYIRDLHILASEMKIYCVCEASEQVVFEFRQLEKDIAEKYKGLLCL